MAKLQIGLMVLGVIAFAVYNQSRTLPTTTSAPPTNNVSENISSIDGHAVQATWLINAVKVVDGDSLRFVDLQGAEKNLRLASIDAPEISQSFGRPAKEHLLSIVGSKQVSFYKTDTDRYGRDVGFAFVPSDFANGRPVELNAQMIADGFAWHSIKYSENSKLTELEATARRLRMGLWTESAPMPPWDYRARK